MGLLVLLVSAIVTVNIIGVTDPEDDPITIEITGVKQDEPVDDTGDGTFAPDAEIGTSSAEVRAERLGNGNGRVYHIEFQAEDGQGGSYAGEVLVGVPHDRNDNPVDDGALYDSTIIP